MRSSGAKRFILGTALLLAACGDGEESTSPGAGNGVTSTDAGGAGGGGPAAGAGGAGTPQANGGSGALGTAGASTGGGFPDSAGAGGAANGAGGALAEGGTNAAGGSEPGGGAPSVGGTTSGAGGAGTAGATAGTLPPVTSVDMDGPYAVTVDQNAGASSWVFRPTELGKDGVKHPVFVWGTGATSVPSRYTDHLTRIASHGFVVISPNNAFVTAALLKASLDWILAQNDVAGGVYFQKLAVNKVGMGGHSLGSVGTFDVEATETRLTTTIHVAGGSFDGKGSSKVKTPTAYICGANGDFAQPNCKVDFESVGTQPTFYSELKGVDHVGAARSALPGIVAWLRWQLAGEVDRKAMFTGPSGTYFQGIWTSQTKNW